VRQEVNAVLAGSLSNPPDDQELARGLRLVGNGYRFGLESPTGVAGVIGNSALWQRPLDLHEPLTTLMALDNTALQAAFRLLDPDQACILEAMPA